MSFQIMQKIKIREAQKTNMSFLIFDSNEMNFYMGIFIKLLDTKY